MIDHQQFQKQLEIHFKNSSLLKQALIHSSYINENPDTALSSNERLEFLGDAVINMVIAEELFKRFPDYDEGELTRLRSVLIKRETLARAARQINLGKYLYLGKGEESGGGREKDTNLAGGLESLIAAIYLDQGLETVRNFVLKLFVTIIQEITGSGAVTDYKSRLQELIQCREQITPSYHLIEAIGPPHEKTFTVEVRAGQIALGRGTGKSKKAAEMEAARVALEKIVLQDDNPQESSTSIK